MPSSDEELMSVAIAEAARADFATSPNPMVGAVVVRDGKVIARGHHRRAGEPHAEVEALAAAGGLAEGAELFVTLEPCTMHGRTPPCVDAVAAARPSRVVVALLDPNPAVDGAGVARLREAGISVTVGPGAVAATRLNDFYITHARTGIPFVTAKFAASLDGRIATRTGESRWISSVESRQLAHRLRHRHDAVLVGVGTVEADDPELSVRLEGGESRQPLRVVVDSRLRTSPNGRLLRAGTGRVVIATTAGASADRRAALEQAGAEVITVAGRDRVAIADLLVRLGKRDVISVLVEGGATLLGSLFDDHQVDRLVAMLAPTVIGGVSAPAAVGGAGAASLAAATRLTDLEVEMCGGDVVVTGYCVK
jgi:diaminohydroxyphosphoribosylaminopyrimidine deaminase/5-amino-6-(5-phosphoribosylamino)uracil reductase